MYIASAASISVLVPCIGRTGIKPTTHLAPVISVRGKLCCSPSQLPLYSNSFALLGLSL